MTKIIYWGHLTAVFGVGWILAEYAPAHVMVAGSLLLVIGTVGARYIGANPPAPKRTPAPPAPPSGRAPGWVDESN